MGDVVVLGHALYNSVSLLMGWYIQWTCPFCALKEVVDKLAALKSGMACYPIRESLQTVDSISIGGLSPELGPTPIGDVRQTRVRICLP